MSFPNRVMFQQNQSQLGRPPVNNDYISGLNFYGAYPSGFSSTNQTIPFLSLTQAENAGIVSNYSDETQAVGSVTITAVGAVNATLSVSINEPAGVVVQLGTYTQVSGDTTEDEVATALTAIINANTKTTGYIAAVDMSNSAKVDITARVGLGIYLNTKTPTVTNAGGTTGTAGAFSGGVASSLAVWHYHISEYFRLMPNGKLFVTVTPTYNSFSDVLSAQAFAQGAIRQFGVYTIASAFSTALVTTAKIVKNTMFNNNQPAEIWIGADISSIADVGGSPGLVDLSGLNVEGTGCSGVGVVVGQDGAALGSYLYAVYGKSITTLGATLGATSNAPVNVDIGWVQQYNITDGTELNVPAFANGQLYSAVFNSENNALTQIDNYRYNFIMSYSGQVGTYFNDDKTATSSTDSYANMNDNRVIDKVHRVVYANLLPLVNGPIELNSDGTIPPLTLANLDSLARNPMEQMARDGEIAGDANGNLAATAVQIDPNQNVVANNGITIGVQPTENGTARQILVPIGYAN